jgi:hypothetical protein
MGMGRSVGDKSGFRRTKLSVFYVNGVTSGCWSHKFLNPQVGSG